VLLSNEITSLANGAPGVGPLTFAGVFLLIALLMPRGLTGTWAQLVEWLERRRETTRGESVLIEAPAIQGSGGDILVPGAQGAAAVPQRGGDGDEPRPG
jgi:hypothetical protein